MFGLGSDEDDRNAAEELAWSLEEERESRDDREPYDPENVHDRELDDGWDGLDW